MTEHAVLILGAGPTGLMLAGELALAGVDVAIAERHPVAARVLRNTMAAVALRRPDERTKALRDTMSELLGMDEPRRRFAAMMSGLDVHYKLGEGHALLGRRIRRLVGASSARTGHCSHRRVDPAGWICGVGGRLNSDGAR